MNVPLSPTAACILLRILAGSLAAITLMFVFNNYLTFWLDWPGADTFLAHKKWFGLGPLQHPLEGEEVTLGWVQFVSYLGAVAAVVGHVCSTPRQSLHAEAAKWGAISAYVLRVAFWWVLLDGVSHMLAFLRDFGVLTEWVARGQLTQTLVTQDPIGTPVHYVLIAASLLIAHFIRTLAFLWLVLLIVAAEFVVVLSGLVLTPEPAFAWNVARVWYAILLMLTAVHTVVHGRRAARLGVFSLPLDERSRARVRIAGSLALGIPMCWSILAAGMWHGTGEINRPLRFFEISHGGFESYVDYQMAGFLLVFAVSMAIQFACVFLRAAAALRSRPGA